MLMCRKDGQELLISAEIAMTSLEVCPICGKPSWHKGTGICIDCFDRMFVEFMQSSDEEMDMDSWINREISIKMSQQKHFILPC